MTPQEVIAKYSLSTAAAQLGRRGGHARAHNLTASQRHKIAQEAAQARWSEKKKKKKED